MQPTHIKCFQAALSGLLGSPASGTVAFIRCLEREHLETLLGAEGLRLDGWVVLGVSDEVDHSEAWITSDRAVEIRESRESSALLLVDASTTGAGMDGIYSAAKEITEHSLFAALRAEAEDRLPWGTKGNTRAAVRVARKLGGRRTIAPWREFDFLARCASTPEAIGLHVSILGLWPVGYDRIPSEADWDIAAGVTTRLLLDHGSGSTTQQRVDSLMIPPSQTEGAAELAGFLHKFAYLPWQEICIKAAEPEQERLWVDCLQPGFADSMLQRIELESWRSSTGKLHKWSGLRQPDSESAPVYNVPDVDAQSSTQLSVRWKTQPPRLPKGTINYRVAIWKSEDELLVERLVSHTGSANYERCSFGPDDFEDYREDGGTWDVHVTVSPEAHNRSDLDGVDDPLCPATEPFTVTFLGGDDGEGSESSSARAVRSMVEFAIQLHESEDRDQAASTTCTQDKKGYIILKVGRKSGKVFQPPLLATLRSLWQQSEYAPGQWIIRVRDDGALLEKPQFARLQDDMLEAKELERTITETRRLAKKTESRQGFLGFLHIENEADGYVNAWTAAYKAGRPCIAACNTALVLDQRGNKRGRLVLPWHPLRVAWQQAYDRLAWHCRFTLDIPLKRTQDVLRQMDPNYFPLFLPGFESSEKYVFGDVLGFHTTAMLCWDEHEPQAALALMARCLFPRTEEIGGLVGYSAAEAIGREVARFSALHPEYHVAKVNALRAGDGLTLSRALGRSLELTANAQAEEDEVPPGIKGFVLSMHPSTANHGMRMVGRHLLETSERRRAGVGAVAKDDRWLLSSYMNEGIPLPRLRWRRCTDPIPPDPAHLAIAFDTFESRLQVASETEIESGRPLEGYGLFAPISRQFSISPLPQWCTALSPNSDGLKHPAGRGFSDRLYELHSLIMRLTAEALGGDKGTWPVLLTTISGERADALQRLHELHEWVLTVDRNAGLEYFDSPRENPEVYDTYVIDCVPEREDLDSVRLVTSTCQLEELRRLLDSALADMGLSGSPRNCVVLLQALKMISGRLAMRLASKGSSRQELIALALLAHLFIKRPAANVAPWLSLERGFIVPLDDVRDLLLDGDRNVEDRTHVRADLVYVELAGRSGLRWTFIEVKFRRLLRSARESLVIQRIDDQTHECANRMMSRYFGSGSSEAEKVVRRKRLVRALQFYADKANRHHLGDDAHTKLTAALAKFLRPDQHDEQPEIRRCGYVFCPEFRGESECLTTAGGPLPVYLFGPDFLIPAGEGGRITFPSPTNAKEVTKLPEESSEAYVVDETDDGRIERPISQDTTEKDSIRESTASVSPAGRAAGDTLDIVLGENARSGESVLWHPSIKGNPHLMIVGLPGMGKTECIVNLCLQLAKSNVRPIVFAYHDDIEDRLNSRFGSTEPVDVHAGLGFNPMKVVGTNPHAWVDHVGMLRDIFSCIFPDFGDRQTNEIREALKLSYIEAGYNDPEAVPGTLTPPQFQRFFSIIRSGKKPNPGVVERLSELDDYGFFRAEGRASTLLESGAPAVVRLYTSRNEVLQRAMAAFVLLHLYQSMFIRGEQGSLTHAVVFDEAHRASGLKLLATMAKECRKFGIALVVSSQAARDFNVGLFSAIANFLTLRMTESDALTLAKNVGAADDARRLAGQLKKLDRYHAVFFREGARDTLLRLEPPPGE